MRGLVRLYRQFMLRSMLRHKLPAAAAVLGIALGVAVMLAIRLANRSITDTFRTAVDSVSGAASLSIVGEAGRFDERKLARLEWLRDYGTASPVIEGYAMLLEPGDPRLSADRVGWPRGEILHLLGIDVLVDRPIREYRLLRTSQEDREPTTEEFLRLVVDPNAVVVTERFARRKGLSIGDRIALAFGSNRKDLVIRGLLLDEGPARTLDGNFAIMDIAAAQWAFGRMGYIDRVDLRLKADIDAAAAERAIAARLPPGLRVEPPDQASSRNETMIAAFHFNLAALSGIALLVGLFLIYNTASIGVAARREEIGILQAVGAGRPTVLALVLGETVLVWGAGFALGILLARWLARGAVGATARTVETFYLAEVAEASARQLSLTRGEILLAVLITLPLALAAAFWPAWRAASIRPIEVIHGAQRMRRNLRPPRALLAAAALLALVGGGLATLPPVGGLPVFGFAAGAVLVLAAAFVVPSVLWAACWLARRAAAPLVRPLRAEFRLASANLLGSIGRVSTSVAALAVSLAMAVAIAVLVGSFRETVIYWLDSTLRADVMVRPITLNSATSEAEIGIDVLDALRRDPDVASVNWVQIRQVPYGDRGIRLAAAPLDLIMKHQTLLFKSPRDPAAAVRRAIAGDEVLVSESFSIRFNKRPGDEVELPTPTGRQAFRVAAVYYDYASNQGTVTVDSGTYRRRFAALGESPLPSSVGLYLRPGADPDTVRQRLAETVPGAEALAIVTNSNVRREALRVFDSTFRITYALEGIAIVIAGLGIFSTLLTLIYERRQEIGLISLVGASPRQVRRMVVLEAVLLGAVSQAVGLLIGLLLAMILIYVVNVQSFGWTIQFHWPPGFVLQSTVLILAAAALFGFYPAIRAANVEALQTVRDE